MINGGWKTKNEWCDLEYSKHRGVAATVHDLCPVRGRFQTCSSARVSLRMLFIGPVIRQGRKLQTGSLLG